MQKKILFFVLLQVLFINSSIKAQRVTLIEPKEDSCIEVLPGHSRIIINSNSANLDMYHSAGNEKAYRTTCDNGKYRYEIDFAFDDDWKGNFIKTTLILQLPGGSRDIKMILYKNKAYVGEFNEKFDVLSYEKGDKEVLAKAKASRVNFFSNLENIDITCNGIQCFNNGRINEKNNDCNIKLYKNQNNAGFNYVMEFLLNEELGCSNFIKHPVFLVSYKNSNVLKIDINEDLAVKTVYNYHINSSIKIIEKELSFDELIRKAEKAAKEGDFYTSMNAYQDARVHEDCPEDQKMILEDLYGKMKSARKYIFIAEKFNNKSLKLEQTCGFEKDSVFIYAIGACKAYRKAEICCQDTNMYKSNIEKIMKRIEDHPLAVKENKVKVKYQVVTGVHPNGGGIPVYASNTYGKYKAKSNQQPLTITNGDGSFRLVFKDKELRPIAIFFYGDEKSYPIDDNTSVIKFK